MAIDNWKTQLRKGLLELCILNLLRRREHYGYDLVQQLKRINGLAMREGTVYPILARMDEEGLVSSLTRPSESGPPRKYFALTPQGRRVLDEMNAHWEEMRGAVAALRQQEVSVDEQH